MTPEQEHALRQLVYYAHIAVTHGVEHDGTEGKRKDCICEGCTNRSELHNANADVRKAFDIRGPALRPGRRGTPPGA